MLQVKYWLDKNGQQNTVKQYNKTKSLKSRERGELKSKIWMMKKVDWWLKLVDY